MVIIDFQYESDAQASGMLAMGMSFGRVAGNEVVFNGLIVVARRKLITVVKFHLHTTT